jgi:single-strand DNA-binding protein
MRETYLTVAGIVATDPTIRTLDDGRKVMSFRMASTSRRFDTNAKTWVDGHTLWVKVSCWRELAENAAHSVRKRDRVVVMGRVRSEQWTVEGGGQRSDLALEADALGHDLTYGIASFSRKIRTKDEHVLTDGTTVDPNTGEIVDNVPADPHAPVFAAEVAPSDGDADDLDDAELDDLSASEGELAPSA